MLVSKIVSPSIITGACTQKNSMHLSCVPILGQFGFVWVWVNMSKWMQFDAILCHLVFLGYSSRLCGHCWSLLGVNFVIVITFGHFWNFEFWDFCLDRRGCAGFLGGDFPPPINHRGPDSHLPRGVQKSLGEPGPLPQKVNFRHRIGNETKCFFHKLLPNESF